jgi:hypothetical protein
MKELTELKKLSKMELLNKCRDLQVKELARIKYEKQQQKVRKWFSRKEESIPEEKKMNETNELKLEFRKVSSIPKSLSGNSQCSETIEKIKSTLLSLDVGEILLFLSMICTQGSPKIEREFIVVNTRPNLILQLNI